MHGIDATPVMNEIRGRLPTQPGKEATIVTVWIIRNGEDFARFVTAFHSALPAGQREGALKLYE